jgi:Tol biopolymer transport system component
MIPAKIWVYSTGTQSARTILESPDRVRILGTTNNGSDLLFIRRSDPTDTGAAPKSTDLFSLPLSGGDPTRIATLANVHFNNVHLSPDRSSIAFVVQKEEGKTALSHAAVSGGSPREIVQELDPKVLFSSLAWAPDGRSIVFGKQTRTSLLSMLTD